MANVPDGLRYTKEHEWAKLDGDVVTVGVTDWAQEQLSDVVYVELPAVGKTVRQGDAFGVIEAVKTVSDLYAPVSGEVIEVNQGLADNPAWVNQSPYEKGWMIKLKTKSAAELNSLLDASSYGTLLEEAAR
ncbi:MAG TPA: glycine cleavage system protein GcvH [Candidatus Eisenbacteria bacterium]|nr:glycine cleavage system protein GcvH [Candidatus Eisenbacteria bacterium]